MSFTVDARGLSCPQPVILTKNKLASLESGTLEVLVDNPAARENVVRFAKSQDCDVKVSTSGEDFLIIITRREQHGGE
jgi:tRNA 2-thiouridine synthesizing protein A